jgi:glycosyltransferase involved in cell wall biosynthesis
MHKIIFEPESTIETPFISVVVTAFNRKEYILEAVKSVLNQTLERSKYEVIVIKNYLDESIDDFLRKNNVVNIYTDEIGLGAKLAYGIERSRGQAISFLEDDDLFLPIKLDEISDIFKKNKDAVYIRNEIYNTVNPNNEISKISMGRDISLINHEKHIINTLDIKNIAHIYHLFRKCGVGNNSSISVRKNFYESSTTFLNDMNYLTDLFLFFWAIFKGKMNELLVFSETPLSIWRIHESWTNTSSQSNLDEFLIKNLRVSNQGIQAYEKFKSIFKSNVLLNNYLQLAQNAWITQRKLTESKKCGISETIALIKVGFYKRDVHVLAVVPLIFFSFLSQGFVSKLFRVGLKKIQSYK